MQPFPLPAPIRRPRGAVVAIGFTMTAGCAIAVIAGAIDLDVYTRAAQTVLGGADPYLTPAGELPYLYPPVAAALFVPLAVCGHPAATMILTMASLAAWTRTLMLILGQLAPHRLAQLPQLVAVSLFLEPIYATLGFGQVNLLLAWLVTEALLGNRAWLIGLAAGLKLTPAIFVLPLLLRRDWRALAHVVTAFAATVAVGWWVAPAASLKYWNGLFAHPAGIGLDYQSNQSLNGTLQRWLAPHHPLIVAALSLAVLVLTVIICRRYRDPVLQLTITGLAGLLISPISWTHHWIWIIPLAGWLYTHHRPRLTVLWGALLTTRPWWWWGDTANPHVFAAVLQGSWTLAAIATLGAITLYPARHDASRRHQPTPALAA